MNAGLARPAPDRVVVFGGMALDDKGAMFRLSDMFELTISQRWWRQARPSLAMLIEMGLLQCRRRLVLCQTSMELPDSAMGRPCCVVGMHASV